MTRYEAKDWSLDVPEGWSHQSDGSCTTFEHPQGVGAFQVSSHRKHEAVSDDDLREFAGDVPLAMVLAGGFTGFRTRFSEDHTFWTVWWLRAGRQMLFVTYNCALPDRGREDAEINRMIQSLTPTYDEHDA